MSNSPILRSHKTLRVHQKRRHETRKPPKPKHQVNRDPDRGFVPYCSAFYEFRAYRAYRLIGVYSCRRHLICASDLLRTPSTELVAPLVGSSSFWLKIRGIWVWGLKERGCKKKNACSRFGRAGFRVARPRSRTLSCTKVALIVRRGFWGAILFYRIVVVKLLAILRPHIAPPLRCQQAPSTRKEQPDDVVGSARKDLQVERSGA